MAEKKHIYLAGSAKDFEFAERWRTKAQGLLGDDWLCISPFRGKVEQCREAFTPNEIVERDLRDIDRASILIAEMVDDEHPYVGTSMEIFYAAAIRNIPVVVWTYHLNNHYWIQKYACRTFPTLEKCCAYTKDFWGTTHGIS